MARTGSLQSLSQPAADSSLYTREPFSQASRTCGSADCHAHGGWRADVGIGPYGETGGGSVGADFISARAAPPRWMHPRRPNAEKPPLGDQGEVARRSRDGGDQKWRGPAAYNPSVSLRLTAPFTQGSLFLRRREHAVRRTALHTAAGGPMWASAPTRGTVEPRCKSRPSPGRA